MTADVAIVGGGPASAAAAIRLARAGVRVTLFERTRHAHDKVCGEFLGGMALDELHALGIDVAALGAQPIARAVLCGGAHAPDVRLPFGAAALSRAVLDEALLSAAAAAGAEVRRGVLVRRADGEALNARDVFIATGKHELGGQQRRPGTAMGGALIGLKQHVVVSSAARADLAGRVAVIPLAGGYAGLQPGDGGRATVCVAITAASFAGHGRSWPRLIETLRLSQPRLDGWLDGAQPCEAKPLAIGRVPYGFVRRTTDGAWWLGDQAAVVPSFAGAGIGLALASAHAAAAGFLAGETAAAFQRRFAAAVTPQMRRAQALSHVLSRPRAAAALIAGLSLAPGLVPSLAGALHRPHPIAGPA